MGIPSYFSYIVKNHANIIKNIKTSTIQIDNLYLDCNSIIYDAVHNIDFTTLVESDINTIITAVISKIDEYIRNLKPLCNVYIAFDGVAPVAKLEQQRSRRYKSLYQNNMSKYIFKDAKPDSWNTTAITPGTTFMTKLNARILKAFNNPDKYNLTRLIVSTSDECGEGEHKLFEHIRRFPDQHIGKNTIIYGLDADLIMLSINHLPITSNIYLFRETPHFIKSINVELEPNELYVMDIPELAHIITLDMNNGSLKQGLNRVYDYIFLCFFLGNDFMPHFPSVNIRTGGINKMINAYKATIGGTNQLLTDGTTIFWGNVRKIVEFLADKEEEHIKTETKLRDKRERYVLRDETPEDKWEKFESIPNYERSLEKYINPFSAGWSNRYYKALFDTDNGIVIDDDFKEKICVNYLEGLEWTMKYYTRGCPDWRWCYNYNYPPLFTDLIRYVPLFEKTLLSNDGRSRGPVNKLVQLCYVLPKQSLNLLPKKLYSVLTKTHPEWYNTNCEFIWAYARYFWEAHVLLPDIKIDELELFVTENA